MCFFVIAPRAVVALLLFHLSAVECVVKSVTSDPSPVLTRAQQGSAGRDSRLRGREITINQETILELEPNT